MSPSGDEVEFKLLLEAVHMKYGYDFRGYAQASMERRMRSVLSKFGIRDFLELTHRLLREPEFFRLILPHLTVTTTEMFRDPQFFQVLRDRVLPVLKTYAALNIWVAGCSHGQEAYSLAILLHEEDLLDRSVIFATDINPQALKGAREGIFPADAVQIYTKNYQQSGGLRSFQEYYVADYGYARMASHLKDNMVFSEHNLSVDNSFTEAHLILCRNVLIYFDKNLQGRALRVFADSLRYRGFLGLGSKENLKFSDVADRFDVFDAKQKIYQKRGGQREVV